MEFYVKVSEETMTLRIGICSAIITPPVGVELSGYAFGSSVGVLEDLNAQALALSDGSAHAILITADLIGFRAELVAALRERIRRNLGLPELAVMCCASHTHSGSATVFLRHWGEYDEVYLNTLEDNLVDISCTAWNHMAPARAGSTIGLAEGLGINRREDRGQTDDEIPILYFSNPSGEILALIYNYACHPVSLHGYKNLIAPDYPGYARQEIQSAVGQSVIPMFTLGAAGDINPRTFVFGQATVEKTQSMGRQLGQGVVHALTSGKDKPEAILKTKSINLELPVLPLTDVNELEELFETSAKKAETNRREGKTLQDIAYEEIHRDWAKEALAEIRANRVKTSRTCEIQIIRIGDAVLAALPLEVFVSTGLAIKAGSRAKVTMVCSNANGGMGYLPTADAYMSAVDYTNPQGLAPKVYDLYCFAPEAEPLLRQTVIDQINSLFS